MLSLRHTTLALSLLASAFAVAADEAQPSKEGLEFFEKNVRPILIDRCYECHSAEKNSSKGGLVVQILHKPEHISQLTEIRASFIIRHTHVILDIT